MACVQAQTYPNLIHVVLDNASTDQTASIIRRFSNGPVPILTRRNEKALPQMPNWNAAFGMIPEEAKYIKLLCADDLMTADAIAKMTALAETDPEIDHVSCIVNYSERTEVHRLDRSISVFDGREYARAVMMLFHPSGPDAFFYRASIPGARRPMNESQINQGDVFTCFEMLFNRKVGFIHEPLYFSRTSETTVTAQRGGARPTIVSFIAIVREYGPKVLSPDELELMKRHTHGAVLRHLLTWVISGDTRNAAYAYEMLTRYREKADWRAILKAVLDWPRYKRERAERFAPFTDRPAHMPEDFYVKPEQWRAVEQPRPAKVAAAG